MHTHNPGVDMFRRALPLTGRKTRQSEFLQPSYEVKGWEPALTVWFQSVLATWGLVPLQICSMMSLSTSAQSLAEAFTAIALTLKSCCMLGWWALRADVTDHRLGCGASGTVVPDAGVRRQVPTSEDSWRVCHSPCQCSRDHTPG